MYKKNIGKGDNGFTDFCSKHIKKTDDEVLLLALIDEINAVCGFVVSKYGIEILKEVEKMNISIMGFIAGYVSSQKVDESIRFIEDEVRKINDVDIKGFVVFDKDEKTSLLNILRTKTRIAEIYAWRADKKNVAVYLNRLSDLVFLIAVREVL